MEKRLEQRMYGLVPYNLSPIQQGIQFGHAVVEYSLNHYSYTEQKGSNPYSQWAHYDKTFIILNGGTTNKNEDRYGTLNIAQSELYAMGVELATFHEPDLGDQLTAVVFLVDERVWDREKYPPYDEAFSHGPSEKNYYKELFGEEAEKIVEMRRFLSRFKLA